MPFFCSVIEVFSYQKYVFGIIEVFSYQKYVFGILITERSVIEILLYHFLVSFFVLLCSLFKIKHRDKVKVTRVKGLFQKLTGLGIDIEVEVNFVDIF